MTARAPKDKFTLSRRRLVRGALAGAAALIARPTRAQSVAEAVTPAERKDIAAIAADYLRTFGVPGLSIAVGRRGQPIYAQGFGVADPATGEAVASDHQFRIAGVSMAVTAATTFALIELGRLRLTDRVFGRNGILRTDYGTPPYGRYIEDINVNHLLTHTSGGWPDDASDPMLANPGFDHAHLIGWVLDNRPLTRAPGTVFMRSNFGYCVLARVIEQAMHGWYATMTRDYVLDRCGLRTMRIGGGTLALRAPREVVYVGQGEDPYGMNLIRMDASNGWVATASDLVTFITQVLGTPGQPGILRPQSVDLMTRLSTLHPTFAKGWTITSDGVGQSGGLPGTSAATMQMSNGLAWAALANSRRATPDSVGGLDKAMRSMLRAVKSWAG